jgi:hypothetical protein
MFFDPVKLHCRQVDRNIGKLIKLTGLDAYLSEWFTILGQHVTAIDDHICLELFCCLEQPVIFPLASVQIRNK